MATFACRVVDPSAEEVRGLFAEAYRTAAAGPVSAPEPLRGADQPPSADELLRSALERPEGVYSREHWADRRYRTGGLLLACWWTDVVGRRHWYFEGAPLSEHSAARRARPEPDLGRWVARQHPLMWIAPELSCGWRTRGGRRELVAMCACGACGTPEEIGWTGPSCGPCFDREQEGLPPLAPPLLRRSVGRVDMFLLTSGGLLLTMVEEAEAPEGGGGGVVRCWARPWTGGPLWERRWADILTFPPCCDDSVAAIYSRPGGLTFLSLADGSSREVFQADFAGLDQMVFAGKNGGVLVTGAGGWTASAYNLSAHECDREGRIGSLLYRHRTEGPPFGTLEVSHSGEQVLVSNLRWIDVRDAATGEVIERLPSSGGRTAYLTRFSPDGAILAVEGPSGHERPLLRRWAPPPSAPPPNRLLSWLRGPPKRRPEKERPLDEPVHGLAVSPDGRVVAGTGMTTLFFWDARTLEELARFEPGDYFRATPAFGPDGQLLAATDSGLVVWPWPELSAAS
jgi:hypothetical protein